MYAAIKKFRPLYKEAGRNSRKRGGLRKVISPILSLMLILSITFLSEPALGFAQLEQDQELTVMTYNIYQGSELQDVLKSSTTSQLLSAVATDFGHVITNNFPERALAIASEVALTNPDLIGLQEVSL
jgi:hypothetical protein